MSALSNALPAGAAISNGSAVYRVECVLGAGGFGITYRVSASIKYGNVTARINFAIKEHFVSSDCERETATSCVVCSNPARERVENSMKDFMSEARRLHKVGIEHPNIVKVNEVFEANNTAYYVMEYLDGESLRSYVKRHGALSEDGMMQIMRPVIDAVGYLHRNHMTHLDVKPDNIMIVKDDEDRIRPVLIDFGLSKHYGADGRPTSTINTLGCSDGYAPTEQYAGITTFSPTADIYALGATMLFCLTGHDPKKSTELRPGDVVAIVAGLPISQSLRDAISGAMAHFDRTPSVDAMFDDPAVGAGRALPAELPANGGATTIRLNRGQRAGHGAAPTEPDKPTQSISAASSTSRRPLIIGVVVAAVLILAAILFFSLGGSDSDEETVVTDSTAVESVAGEPVSAELYGHATPADFDLACVRDGRYRYFTESEWNDTPDKSSYEKKGIVLTDFIVALNDLTSKKLNWNDAMARYGNQLPDRDQGIAIGDNLIALNRAIKKFGGSSIVLKKNDYGPWYWTKEEQLSDPDYAWLVSIVNGGIHRSDKEELQKVRAVTPLPTK